MIKIPVDYQKDLMISDFGLMFTNIHSNHKKESILKGEIVI